MIKEANIAAVRGPDSCMGTGGVAPAKLEAKQHETVSQKKK